MLTQHQMNTEWKHHGVYTAAWRKHMVEISVYFFYSNTQFTKQLDLKLTTYSTMRAAYMSIKGKVLEVRTYRRWWQC